MPRACVLRQIRQSRRSRSQYHPAGAECPPSPPAVEIIIFGEGDGRACRIHFDRRKICRDISALAAFAAAPSECAARTGPNRSSRQTLACRHCAPCAKPHAQKHPLRRECFSTPFCTIQAKPTATFRFYLPAAETANGKHIAGFIAQPQFGLGGRGVNKGRHIIATARHGPPEQGANRRSSQIFGRCEYHDVLFD